MAWRGLSTPSGKRSPSTHWNPPVVAGSPPLRPRRSRGSPPAGTRPLCRLPSSLTFPVANVVSAWRTCPRSHPRTRRSPLVLRPLAATTCAARSGLRPSHRTHPHPPRPPCPAAPHRHPIPPRLALRASRSLPAHTPRHPDTPHHIPSLSLRPAPPSLPSRLGLRASRQALAPVPGRRLCPPTGQPTTASARGGGTAPPATPPLAPALPPTCLPHPSHFPLTEKAPL